ncbi:MAG TPA: contractile injection system tape measure protein [Saprospiraceae bacterium]|nr:contractile injection system tape measure protein [Saprospiraceae bacterium]HMQ82152.1 contractile injection system tape measure protein [Saprospiraceae bacterium]
MNTEQRHIIHRQVIDLKLHSRSEAFRIQSQVSELFQGAVVEKLAAHFDQLGLGHAVLRIPKMEIDLGKIAIESLERDFAAQCAYAIEQEVARILGQLNFQSDTEGASSAATKHQDALLSTSQSRLEALECFLKKGYLPVLWKEKTWPQLEALWLEMLREQPEPIIHRIRQWVAEMPVVLQRLLRQFSPEWIHELLQAMVYLDGNHPYPSEAPAFGSVLHSESQVRAWWLLDAVLWRILPESLRRLMTALMDRATPPTPPDLSKFQQETRNQLLLKKLMIHPAKEWPSVLQKQLEELHSGQLLEKSATDEQEPSPIEAPDKIAVGHAGLVILHPFLPALFDALKYLNGKTWQDKSLQERAMHVLLYLACGEENRSEQEFLMAKLLCAWPLNEPLDRFIALTEQEKQEADELLGAVLRHWSALKSTSADLLRNGFLQRSGLLTFREKGWLVQLEHQAQDVLLDKLPWGIGMIQLPWMKGQLGVEW